MNIDDFTLDDFIATKVDGGTMYRAKEYACGCVIFDNMPGKDDADTLLAEIKATIRRATINARKGAAS